MSGCIELDAFCAKKRGLSYGQYMALTDEKERRRLERQFRAEFDEARKKARRRNGDVGESDRP